MTILGFNGGLLGTRRVPTQAAASGIWLLDEQSIAQRNLIWPTTNDIYFANVSLLLHMNGSNGTAIFLDSSPAPSVITPVGNAQISTTQSKFGGASGYFDGDGDRLIIASNNSLNFGTGDFTIELWAYHTSFVSDRFYVSAEGNGGLFFGIGTNANNIGYGRAGIAWDASVPHGMSVNTWNHIALCRSGDSIRIFINGFQVGSTQTNTNAYNLSTTALNIASQGTQYYINAFIDELRITKGIARYQSSSFAVLTTPFPDTGPTLDPFRSSVSLLLHMDGSNGSTVFTDNSSNAVAVTANGNAQISTAESKFGGASGYFDGTNDSLTFADPALGTGDFTIEMWVKTNSNVQYAQLIGNETGGNGYTLLINNNSATGGQIALWRANGTLVASTSTGDWSDDSWHHVALTRSGSSVTIWTDGTSNGTGTTSASFDGSSLCYVGRNNVYSSRNLVGYIDELRITKAARYNRNFTPSTTPFPDS